MERWRTYLYDDGIAAPMVGHLNGAQTKAWATLQERHGEHRNGAGQRWQRKEPGGHGICAEAGLDDGREEGLLVAAFSGVMLGGGALAGPASHATCVAAAAVGLD